MVGLPKVQNVGLPKCFLCNLKQGNTPCHPSFTWPEGYGRWLLSSEHREDILCCCSHSCDNFFTAMQSKVLKRMSLNKCGCSSTNLTPFFKGKVGNWKERAYRPKIKLAQTASMLTNWYFLRPEPFSWRNTIYSICKIFQNCRYHFLHISVKYRWILSLYGLFWRSHESPKLTYNAYISWMKHLVSRVFQSEVPKSQKLTKWKMYKIVFIDIFWPKVYGFKLFCITF